MRHAVIMAGGAGTRLWPLSRKNRPKQLLRLFDGASLLQIAQRRLAGLFPPENIWVITSAAYIEQVARELPDVPRGNLIGEPLIRDTANAIGLAANLLARRDPDATMSVFTADHIIEPVAAFAAAIRTGLAAAERSPDHLVTFGITPRTAHTGYGYVRRGESVAAHTFRVVEFKEKPSAAVAEQYVKSGAYYWNSGMFAWRATAILAELGRCLPENAAILADLAANWESRSGSEHAAQCFGQLRKISIDYGVMEQAALDQRVLVVEMNCRWLDVGSYPAIAATRPPDDAGNVQVAANGLVVGGSNNILVSESEHALVVLGASDLIVVHSADTTLICRRDQAERIKDLVGLRVEKFGERFE
jgi:mannose-1-phosphate guanylyltransferase